MKTILIHNIWLDIDGQVVTTNHVVDVASQQELKDKIKLSLLLDMKRNGLLALPIGNECLVKQDVKHTVPDDCQVFLPA